MLQCRSHLQLERQVIESWMFGVEVQLAGHAANVVQRVIAEAIELVHLPLVNGIGPVNVEQRLDNGRDAVDVLIIKGDDTGTKDVGDVGERLVLMSLALQLARKRLLGFHP